MRDAEGAEKGLDGRCDRATVVRVGVSELGLVQERWAMSLRLAQRVTMMKRRKVADCKKSF